MFNATAFIDNAFEVMFMSPEVNVFILKSGITAMESSIETLAISVESPN